MKIESEGFFIIKGKDTCPYVQYTHWHIEGLVSTIYNSSYTRSLHLTG